MGLSCKSPSHTCTPQVFGVRLWGLTLSSCVWASWVKTVLLLWPCIHDNWRCKTGAAGRSPTAESSWKVTNGSANFGKTTRLSSIKSDAQMVEFTTSLEMLELTLLDFRLLFTYLFCEISIDNQWVWFCLSWFHWFYPCWVKLKWTKTLLCFDLAMEWFSTRRTDCVQCEQTQPSTQNSIMLMTCV